MTPEQIGLTGCWQVLAVRRERILLSHTPQETSVEIGYYVTSLAAEESSPQDLGQLVRDHWAAIENGVHYRRDWTFREDHRQVKDWVGAEMLATLCNLAIGLYELGRKRKQTTADSLKNWVERQTFSSAWKQLQR